MSRKSAAALSLVAVIPGQRPEPPDDLSEVAAVVWREVVATKPHDWFAGSLDHLGVYCTLIADWKEYRAQRYALRATPDDDFGAQLEKLNAKVALDKTLHTLAEKINSTATKLRICPSSRERADHTAVAHNQTARKKLHEA